MSYTLLKTLHVSAVTLTFILFLWRWLYVLGHDPAIRPPWMRWLPHLNDSLLFFLGLGLAWKIGQSPFAAGWLAAKLAALLVYIFLGLYVMRFARSPQRRLLGGIAALLTFAYMVGVAVTKNAGFVLGL